MANDVLNLINGGFNPRWAGSGLTMSNRRPERSMGGSPVGCGRCRGGRGCGARGLCVARLVPDRPPGRPAPPRRQGGRECCLSPRPRPGTTASRLPRRHRGHSTRRTEPALLCFRRRAVRQREPHHGGWDGELHLRKPSVSSAASARGTCPSTSSRGRLPRHWRVAIALWPSPARSRP